MDDVEMG